MAKNIVAIMYDFDRTLSTTDMQNYSFIPNMGMEPKEFWGSIDQFANKEGVERILSYMYMMIEIAKQKGIEVTKEYLKECGKNIKFYPGVTTWFKRINEYGASKGIKVEHYLVSSGTKEIVDGCSIVDEFTKIFACEFYFNEENKPVWPKLAINYTQKTQYFFRIAKGAINDITDDKTVNTKVGELGGYRIPYRNIIYIGDGMTDIACMTLVKDKGGKSIAVYPEHESEKVKGIYEDDRVNFICRADYCANSDIEKVVHLIIDSCALQNEIDKKELLLAKK